MPPVDVSEVSPASSPVSARAPQAVLFVCGMNAVRSPMASALARHHFGRSVYVTSAGVRHGEVDPFAISVMREVGLDISEHQPRSLEELADTSFDLIVTLAPEAHHKTLELTRTMAVDVEYWPTADPTVVQGSRDRILDAYRAIRDGLLKRIRERLSTTSASSD